MCRVGNSLYFSLTAVTSGSRSVLYDPMRQRLIARLTESQISAAERIAVDLKLSKPDAIRLVVRQGLRSLYSVDDISAFVEHGATSPRQMWCDDDVFDDIEVMMAKFQGARSTVVRAAIELGVQNYGKTWPTTEESR